MKLMPGEFFEMPSAVFQMDLTTDELATYAYLRYRKNNRTYKCWPSYKTIGEAIAYAAPPVRLDRVPWCILTGRMVHGDRERGARPRSPLCHSVRMPLRLRMVSPSIRIT